MFCFSIKAYIVTPHLTVSFLYFLNALKMILSALDRKGDNRAKVVIITNFGQRQKSALNAENTTDLPETLQVHSLCY